MTQALALNNNRESYSFGDVHPVAIYKISLLERCDSASSRP